jgi:hypothetical protein
MRGGPVSAIGKSFLKLIVASRVIEEMTRFSQKAKLNEAFKMVQPLPALPIEEVEGLLRSNNVDKTEVPPMSVRAAPVGSGVRAVLLFKRSPLGNRATGCADAP